MIETIQYDPILLARELGAIDSRLKGIEELLIELRNEQRALWKRIDEHSQQLTMIKTKHAMLAAIIAAAVAMTGHVVTLWWRR